MTRRAFTLIELVAVMIVVSVLAASAAPVLSRVSETRREAFAQEIERLLSLARSRAMETSLAAGVRFNVDDQTIELVEIPQAGGAPRAFTETYIIASRITGVEMAQLTVAGNTRTIWFEPDATPHTRNETSGAFIEFLDENASVTVQGGATIIVEPNSGRITR